MGGGGGGPIGTAGAGLTQQITEIERQINETTRKQLAELRLERRLRVVDNAITHAPPDRLGVAFLDVGQGDGSVIKLPNGKVMVIDCNIERATEDIVEFLKRTGVERVDYLVVTHPHYDHMSGLREIAEHFEVGELWRTEFKRKRENESPESWETYQEYERTVQLMERRGTRIVYPNAASRPFRSEGAANIYCYSPSSGVPPEEQDIHTDSIVLHIAYGKSSVTFGGDMNNEGWERIATHYEIKSTVLHASHHGADVGCNETAVKQIRPEYTVISVGPNNFGHPHEGALETYKRNSRRGVLLTDEGSVGFLMDDSGGVASVQ